MNLHIFDLFFYVYKDINTKETLYLDLPVNTSKSYLSFGLDIGISISATPAFNF